MPAPFRDQLFTFPQADGSELRVRGTGNQFQAWFETLVGEPLVEDPGTGYLRKAAAGEMEGAAPFANIAPEARRAAGLERGKTRWEERRAAAKRRLRLAPLETAAFEAVERRVAGDYLGLCLLIEFPDVRGTIRREEVEAFCNQPGYSGFGNNGSVHDYFLDSSGGMLRYTNVVAPYYRARRPRSHYTDPTVHWPDRALELIREALEHHKSRGFDFSRLTADGDGHLRALNVFYAGARVNQHSQGLWPHSYSLSPPVPLTPDLKAADYQITDMGTELTLGTFCHENGHMICDFPDLYDVGNQSFGAGDFCLMAYGGTPAPTNPAHVCAYLKLQAGWAESVTRIEPGIQVALDAGRNDFALFERSPTEYFVLENRLKSGRDAALPGSGLAIWHVDELGSNENEAATPESHYECSLEQADGQLDLERRRDAGDADDLFQSTGNDRFDDATRPASRWWDDTASNLKICRIGPAGPRITFETGS